MAHFSGGDTRFSQKPSPLLSRYNVYLHALAEGGLTLPIFYFMLFYRTLFELSLGRTSRQREHRADRIAAEVTGPNSVAKALLKVGAYSSYRGRVEHLLFSQEQALAQLGIPARVAQGFTSYAGAPEVMQDLNGASFPHPFDTHPSLEARVAAVGASIAEADYPGILQSPVRDSWFGAIQTALGEVLGLDRAPLPSHERSPYQGPTVSGAKLSICRSRIKRRRPQRLVCGSPAENRKVQSDRVSDVPG